MDRPNTTPVTETRGAYRPAASSCSRTWMARDTNRYIRRKNRQCSGLVCRRVSRTLDAELGYRADLRTLSGAIDPVGPDQKVGRNFPRFADLVNHVDRQGASAR